MNKWLYIILAIFLSVLIVLSVRVYGSSRTSDIQDCFVETKEMIVQGNSLEPLIMPRKTIKVLFGYYSCHEIKREDVVLFDYAASKNPVIKIVKGIPGDKFELKHSGSGWNLLINNKVVKNSESEPYLITDHGYRMLSLYEQDYHGIIPPNTYLLLGNLAGGSLDSTVFGLVDKSDIIAKVEI